MGEWHIGCGYQPSFNQPAGASALRFLNRLCNEVTSAPLFTLSTHSRLQQQTPLYVWFTGARRIQLGFWEVGRDLYSGQVAARK